MLAAGGWLAAGRGWAGGGGIGVGGGHRLWPSAAEVGRGEGNWDPEEEWLLELNAHLPAEIDANTRRYQGVRDRMRREHGGRLPVTFVQPGWRNAEESYRKLWAEEKDSTLKVRCVQAAFFVGVNCVPARMICNRKYS